MTTPTWETHEVHAGIRAYESTDSNLSDGWDAPGYWLGTKCDEIVIDALRDEFPGPSLVRKLGLLGSPPNSRHP